VLPTAPRRGRIWPALVAVAVVIGGGGLGAVVWWQRDHEPHTESGKVTPTAVATAATSPAGPIDVLVLPFDNRTGEPVFDNTLDDAMKTMLRASTSLEPISGTDLQQLAEEVAPGTPIDAALGNKLAARDKRRVLLLGGKVFAKSGGYRLDVSAVDTQSGQTILQRAIDAPGIDDVVAPLRTWGQDLRKAVGETIPPDEPIGISTKLAAVHEGALGSLLIQSMNGGEARVHLQRAVQLDPRYALAWARLAVANSNESRYAEVEVAQGNAAKLSGEMTERDRLRFLGDYFDMTTGQYDRSVAAYQDLLRKWPTDEAAESNLANTFNDMHDVAQAITMNRRAIKDHPRTQIPRLNLVNVEIFAGDFAAARNDLDEIERLFPRMMAPALEDRGLLDALEGHHDAMLADYAKFAAADPADGLLANADLALAASELAAAQRLLEPAVAATRAAGDIDALEATLVLLAETKLRRGDKTGAIAAAAGVTKDLNRLFLAALVRIAAGDAKGAAAIADRLAREVPPGRRAMAELLTGEAARAAKQAKTAVAAIREALALDDSWLGHFLLGEALFAAGQYAEAETELAGCKQRRGESTAALSQEISSLRAWPPAVYWLARAQDAQHEAAAKATYAEFLAGQSSADRDPLVVDAQKRSAALK
jgi:tetratricopeptide (TPR) repeat protein